MKLRISDLTSRRPGLEQSRSYSEGSCALMGGTGST